MQPFLPQREGDYFSWPLLTDLFPWQHSGIQYKRTWPIAETADLLARRWTALILSGSDQCRELLRETDARRADGQYRSFIGTMQRLPPIARLEQNVPPLEAVRYAFRSLDRQWALPDVRLCDRPRPALWGAHSGKQIYLTSLLSDVLGLGSAAVATALLPDLHHFSGRGGKDAIPLYRDAAAIQANITHDLLTRLGSELGEAVSPEDLLSYCYALLASPAYVDRFSEELTLPGPRIPITKNVMLFQRAIELGRNLIWLHTFGDRFVPEGSRVGEVPQGSARCIRGVPTEADGYPEEFSFELQGELLRIGEGEVGPVSDAVWRFSISGLPVLQSWLAYRMKGGAGRRSSPLDDIRPGQWTATMTQELLEVIWVLEATIDRFADIESLLNSIIEGPTFAATELPSPGDEEREPPAAGDQPHQIELDM